MYNRVNKFYCLKYDFYAQKNRKYSKIIPFKNDMILIIIKKKHLEHNL